MTATTEQTTATGTEQENATEPSQENATNTEQVTEEKATPQELKQREIVASKQKLVDEGTIDYKDLAPWLQERITPKAKEEVSETDQLREKLSQEIREDMEYEAMKKTIPSDTPKEKLEKMEEIMGDPQFEKMSKPERLEYAKFKAGVTSNEDVEKARKEGVKIGRFGILGLGNHDPNEKAEDEMSKIEKKYDSIPKFLQKK